MTNVENGWVLFELAGDHYGVPTENVLEMVILNDVSKVQNAPDYVRGVMNLRGTILPLVDMRKKLGLESVSDQQVSIEQTLTQRKADHVNWLKELERTTKENTEFRLTTDPHKCAFGKWYDGFETDKPVLRMHLDQFDRPHKTIHGIAIQVQKLLAEKHQDEALALIEKTRDHELSLMIRLFDETHEILKSETKEIVVVVAEDERKMGFIVDSVSEVREILPKNIQSELSGELSVNRTYIHGISDIDNQLRLLLDIQTLQLSQDLDTVQEFA
ncbi:MAG: hypothetical protein GY854_06145 [Deltaproteobacteria bacterium]|nr:hypothetical protein [Deltaproteobacteria bacterium]